MTLPHILVLDIAGNPFRWMDPPSAAAYIASDKVAWALGEPAVVFHGGTNRMGHRSELVIPPIIAMSNSGTMAAHLRESIHLGDRNDMLFRRDRNLCAYCGERYADGQLTRDHVVPTSRGGRDCWENCVSACRACNEGKAARTPEEWGRKLLYVPYAPSRYEHFILQRRSILADQMEYLIAKVGPHSRML